VGGEVTAGVKEMIISMTSMENSEINTIDQANLMLIKLKERLP
jgi:hypothetical protein